MEMYAFLLLWLVSVGEKVGEMGADENTATAATTKGKRTTSKTAAASKGWFILILSATDKPMHSLQFHMQ